MTAAWQTLVLAWVANYYVAATLLLCLAFLLRLVLRHPAQRMALAWACSAALLVFALLSVLPGYSRFKLVESPWVASIENTVATDEANATEEIVAMEEIGPLVLSNNVQSLVALPSAAQSSDVSSIDTDLSAAEAGNAESSTVESGTIELSDKPLSADNELGALADDAVTDENWPAEQPPAETLLGEVPAAEITRLETTQSEAMQATAAAASPRALEPRSPAAPPRPDWHWQSLVLGLLLTGCALTLAWLAWGALQVARLVRGARPAPDSLAAQFQTWSGGQPCAELALSEQLFQPAAMCAWRPRILLPAALVEEGPPSLLQSVVLHEQAHVGSGDLWLNLLARVTLPLLFAHPLFWIWRAKMREDQELLADAVAAGQRGAESYAEDLLALVRRDLARRDRGGMFSLVGLGMADRETSFTKRIRTLLSRPFDARLRGLRLWRWGLVALGLAWAVGAASVAWRPEVAAAEPAAKTGKSASTNDASHPAAELDLFSESDDQPTTQTSITAVPEVASSAFGTSAEPAAADPFAETVAPAKRLAKRKVLKGQRRYGDKNFSQWEIQLRTELKDESRIEAIDAMSIFAQHGYADEVATDILEAIAGDVDLDEKGYLDPEGDFENAVLHQSVDRALRMCGYAVVPVLLEAIAENDRPLQFYAAQRLSAISPFIDKQQGIEVAKHLQKFAQAEGAPEISYLILRSLDPEVQSAIDNQGQLTSRLLDEMATQEILADKTISWLKGEVIQTRLPESVKMKICAMLGSSGMVSAHSALNQIVNWPEKGEVIRHISEYPLKISDEVRLAAKQALEKMDAAQAEGHRLKPSLRRASGMGGAATRRGFNSGMSRRSLGEMTGIGGSTRTPATPRSFPSPSTRSATPAATVPTPAPEPVTDEPKKNEAAPSADAAKQKAPKKNLLYKNMPFGGWAAQLHNELDVESRKQAVNALAIFAKNGYATEVVADLMEVISSQGYMDELQLRFPIYIALGHCGDVAIPSVMQWLKGDNRQLRFFAIQVLRNLPKNEEVKEQLLKVTQEPDDLALSYTALVFLSQQYSEDQATNKVIEQLWNRMLDDLATQKTLLESMIPSLCYELVHSKLPDSVKNNICVVLGSTHMHYAYEVLKKVADVSDEGKKHAKANGTTYPEFDEVVRKVANEEVKKMDAAVAGGHPLKGPRHAFGGVNFGVEAVFFGLTTPLPPKVAAVSGDNGLTPSTAEPLTEPVPAEPKKDKSAPSAGTAKQKVPKEQLRYNDKTFADWEAQLQTELDDESRERAITALAVFTQHGYAQEVATDIIEVVAGQADQGELGYLNEEGEITHPGLATEIGQVLAMCGSAAVPVLESTLHQDNRPSRFFVVDSLRNIQQWGSFVFKNRLIRADKNTHIETTKFLEKLAQAPGDPELSYYAYLLLSQKNRAVIDKDGQLGMKLLDELSAQETLFERTISLLESQLTGGGPPFSKPPLSEAVKIKLCVVLGNSGTQVGYRALKQVAEWTEQGEKEAKENGRFYPDVTKPVVEVAKKEIEKMDAAVAEGHPLKPPHRMGSGMGGGMF